jgi:hypothetical protein
VLQQSLTRPFAISIWQQASSLVFSIARAREARLLIADTLTCCAAANERMVWPSKSVAINVSR